MKMSEISSSFYISVISYNCACSSFGKQASESVLPSPLYNSQQNIVTETEHRLP